MSFDPQRSIFNANSDHDEVFTEEGHTIGSFDFAVHEEGVYLTAHGYGVKRETLAVNLSSAEWLRLQAKITHELMNKDVTL